MSKMIYGESSETFHTEAPPPHTPYEMRERRRVKPKTAIAPTIGPDGKPLYFGEEPIPYNCPFCGVHVVTAVHYKPGGHAWCICCIISAFIVPNLLCLCYVPMCISKHCDVEHVCPNCARTINIARRQWGGATK